MPFQKSLAFSSVSDITFHADNNEVKISVSGTVLGSINKNYPVTVYVEIQSGGTKLLWMKEISAGDYTRYNNGESARTIRFDQTSGRTNFQVVKCASVNDLYKMIGWDEEGNEGVCHSGSTDYFDISDEMNFKSKIEIFQVAGQDTPRMIVRYDHDVNNPCAGSNPECSTNWFCYTCS